MSFMGWGGVCWEKWEGLISGLDGKMGGAYCPLKGKGAWLVWGVNG